MLFTQKEKKEIRARLAEMQDPVEIVNFTEMFESVFMRETREVLEALTEFSGRVKLTSLDFNDDSDLASKYGVGQLPATLLIGEKDFGVRYYGMLTGFQFRTLLDDILMISQGDSGLKTQTRAGLKQIESKTAVDVFVTTTNKAGAHDARLAHQFAMENDFISSNMIEFSGFPDLAQKYQVSDSPKTVINGWGIPYENMSEELLLSELTRCASYQMSTLY